MGGAKLISTVLANLDLHGTGYCASLNFRRTARAVTRMYDAAMQASGVRSTQFAILIGIAKTQPVSMSVLAKVLVIDHTTLTRSVRLLQKEKLVTISERSTMRRKYLELTPGGERALERSLPLWRAVHAQFVSSVGAEYWLKLRSELEDLAKNTMALEPVQATTAGKLNRPAKRHRGSNSAEG